MSVVTPPDDGAHISSAAFHRTVLKTGRKADHYGLSPTAKEALIAIAVDLG